MIKKKYRNSFFVYETKDEHRLYLNINTTPLIDVLLVLIIMIIITMPIQLNKLDLSLSQGQEGSKIRENIVLINIKRDDTVFLNGKKIGKSRDEIRRSLETLYIDFPEAFLRLKVDANTKYSSIVRILSETVRAGFKSVDLPSTNMESR
jgi:biopolymer transport protein ExbD